MQVTATFIFAALLIVQVSALQKDDGVDDYGPGPASDDPKSGPPRDSKSVDGATGEAGPEGGLSEAEEEPELAKTKFSDDRFAKLFPNRGASRTFQARNVAKPKPTLPSFIKSTQAYAKVELRTTPTPRGGVRGRANNQATTRRPTSSSSTTARPRRGNLPTQRQLSGRLTSASPLRASPAGSNSASATTPSPAALAAARRLRQPNNGVSRFQRNQLATPNNSTIPALNPRRN